MLARCHRTTVALVFPLSLNPLSSLRIPLLLSTFLTHSPPRIKTTATWSGSTRIEGSTPYFLHRTAQQNTMDSMPIRTVPVPSVDALKIAEPDTKIQHVEHVNAPANAEHHEHLPKGISETDEEKKTHWFIGSIDCGTTSSRFLVFDGEGTPIASHQIEFENIYPESG